MEFENERRNTFDCTTASSRTRISKRLFLFCENGSLLPSAGRERRILLCLFMGGKWWRLRDPRRHRRRATAAVFFFVDATKKYGRIITSFVVVPFRPARSASRKVSRCLPLPVAAAAPSIRPFFFHGDVDDRVKFLLRQRACLARSLAIASPYTERRGKREKDFTSCLGIASLIGIDRSRRITMMIV